LSFEVIAILGRGKEHVKWSPGHAFYKCMPKIVISGKIDNADAVAKACPRNIFKVKSGSLELNKDKVMDCNLCGACTDLTSGIKLNESEDEYVFTVETWKQLQIKEILVQALKELDFMAEEFSSGLKDL
jgi:DNA-directed RNA polymerase subunit D